MSQIECLFSKSQKNLNLHPPTVSLPFKETIIK
jgi:hypothetical protein